MSLCARCDHPFEQIEKGAKRLYCSDHCRKQTRVEQRRQLRQDEREMAETWEDFFGDLLHEVVPDGLTDDCPARR